MSKPATVDDYIKRAPMDQQTELGEIRRLIERNFPVGKPAIGPAGYPVYTTGKQWHAGFAYKPTGPVIYIADTALINQYEDKLAPVRAGKTCLRFQSARGLAMGELCRILVETLQTVQQKHQT